MNNFGHRLGLAFATGFGIGHILPRGGGTLAATVALVFLPPFLFLPLLFQLTLIFLGSLLGIFASSQAETHFGVRDDQRIVIDEIVSVFISFAGLGIFMTLPLAGIGLILNRALDVWKPYPIRVIERAPRGWGIMLDDIAVGIAVNILLRLILLIL
jgi:phosphatidylglycerophosphatase A